MHKHTNFPQQLQSACRDVHFVLEAKMPEPSSAELLYFYSFRSTPQKKSSKQDGYYAWVKYAAFSLDYKTLHHNENHSRDYKDAFFFTNGFPTLSNPTLILDFAQVARKSISWSV
ncbi:uncharacterized protein LOC133803742 [Humulus lupulus]|uniref:uncharacterized protein LOC133803742 n=1 Tax=Humulus lupulus TaxID=3486 RepID=UPI002B406CB0|nr:uncharacterized protein LOC133803742 [Humulus lupulus]